MDVFLNTGGNEYMMMHAGERGFKERTYLVFFARFDSCGGVTREEYDIELVRVFSLSGEFKNMAIRPMDERMEVLIPSKNPPQRKKRFHINQSCFFQIIKSNFISST